MDRAEIGHWRLHSLRVTTPKMPDAASVVRWLGAVQSQDYPGGKWSIGQRTGLTNAELDRLFDDGVVLRTHALRPTWHFLVPEDIRWIQALTGPRVRTRCQLIFERSGL